MNASAAFGTGGEFIRNPLIIFIRNPLIQIAFQKRPRNRNMIRNDLGIALIPYEYDHMNGNPLISGFCMNMIAIPRSFLIYLSIWL